MVFFILELIVGKSIKLSRDLNFPANNIEEHLEVTDKAIKWVLKSRWPILFKDEMANPGKSIPYQQDKWNLHKLKSCNEIA